MPKYNTTAAAEKPEATVQDGALFSLDEVRKMAKFDILLPADPSAENAFEQMEYPEINGKITQIKRGEVVTVNYIILEALLNSGRYDTSIIRG